MNSLIYSKSNNKASHSKQHHEQTHHKSPGSFLFIAGLLAYSWLRIGKEVYQLTIVYSF